MAINYSDFIVFDFETGNKDSAIAPVLQIGACVVRANNLEIKDDTFLSYCKPEADEMKYVEDEALKVNHIKREDIDSFPLISEVFKSFASWIQKYNYKKTSFTAPIASGYNIKGYDFPIFERYCKRYGMLDSNGKQNLFSNFKMVDVMSDIIFLWTENSNEPKNIKLDTIREHLGLKTEGQNHSALKDAKDTALILQRFLRFYRSLGEHKNYFKNSFNDA